MYAGGCQKRGSRASDKAHSKRPLLITAHLVLSLSQKTVVCLFGAHSEADYSVCPLKSAKLPGGPGPKATGDELEIRTGATMQSQFSYQISL